MKMPPQLVVAPCPICGTPIEVEVDFSTEYKRIRHTPGSDSAKVFGSIAEVRLIPAEVPSQRFYFGEPRYLDSAEFYQMQDAQEWVDNWCENAKIHKLWIDQQYRKGDLNCSN